MCAKPLISAATEYFFSGGAIATGSRYYKQNLVESWFQDGSMDDDGTAVTKE